MIIYIDENMTAHLAHLLNKLQEALNVQHETQIEVRSRMEQFGTGAKDEDWVPKLDSGSFVITQDLRIQTTRHQRDLYEKHGIGMFFVKPPSNKGFSFMEMTKLLVNRWEEILKIIKRDSPPFAYRCTSRKKFEKWD